MNPKCPNCQRELSRSLGKTNEFVCLPCNKTYDEAVLESPLFGTGNFGDIFSNLFGKKP